MCFFDLSQEAQQKVTQCNHDLICVIGVANGVKSFVFVICVCALLRHHTQRTECTSVQAFLFN